MSAPLNIAANRQANKYTRREHILRVLWALAQPLFRYSPRPCFGWRRSLLRLFGAQVGPHVHIAPSAQIMFPWQLQIGAWSAIGDQVRIYNLGRITIGEQVTISQHAHLCAGTHDYAQASMPLLKPPIQIHDQAWVCADAFVGPNVTVAAGAVVGARAVVVADVPSWTIVAGNPAQHIGERRLEPDS